MSNSDRRPYETATVLDQDFLDAAQDNLVNQLELIVDIERPHRPELGETEGGGPYFIYASDRNKYVGETFYEALLTFPIIQRTIGEWLSPELEFSSIQLELTNVDGRLNDLLPAGGNYDGWIGRDVVVKLGLRDVESTYTTIFSGKISAEGGFQRSVSSVTIEARSEFEKLNVSFPTVVFDETTYPNIEDNHLNTFIPVVYGDWTVGVEPDQASVPAIPVNGNDSDVNGDDGMGGGSFSNNVQCVISINNNVSFDTSQVFLVRGDSAWLIPSADIVNVGGGNNTFEIKQESGTMTAVTPDTDDEVLQFAQGDEFYVKVKGKDIGGYDDNIVSQARDILETYAGAVTGDFDSSWDTYRDKASPSESAISTFKSRIWVQDPQEALNYVLSLLEQVRLEIFIDRNQKIKMSSLHLDEFEAAPTFEIKNWDVEKGSFEPKIDDRNNFNRATADFNFFPNRDENYQATPVFKNQAAIDQADATAISKKIVFPNLYEQATVEAQLKEILKLASGYIEHIEVNATWRSLLLDISDFVKINVSIQGTEFDEVPGLIRSIGYDPQGLKIPLRIWSFQMLPFPGYTPGYAGITGGSTATIEQE